MEKIVYFISSHENAILLTAGAISLVIVVLIKVVSSRYKDKVTSNAQSLDCGQRCSVSLDCDCEMDGVSEGEKSQLARLIKDRASLNRDLLSR